MNIVSNWIESRNRKKRGRLYLEPNALPSSPDYSSLKKGLKTTALSILGVAALALLGYKGCVQPYQEDQRWYPEALQQVQQIEQYEREGNTAAAEKSENNLWSDIGIKNREGSWVRDSEIKDITSRLNNNKTEGASGAASR